MCEAFIGLIGAMIGGVITLVSQHFQGEKERRKMLQEKLERAVSAANRPSLCLRWIRRARGDLQQVSGDDNNVEKLFEEKINQRRVMEDSVMELSTLCDVYFPDNKVRELIIEYNEVLLTAYATDSIEKVREAEHIQQKIVALLRSIFNVGCCE